MLKQIEQYTFYALIFFLPLQVRYALGGFVDGPFHEYTHAFVYGTDMLLVALFVLWGVRTLLEKEVNKHKKQAVSRIDRFIRVSTLLLVLAGAISITTAAEPMLGSYQLVRLIGGVVLFLYVQSNYNRYRFVDIFTTLVLSGLVQATIALGQGIMQRDLGLWFFGESPLSASTPGVAKIDLAGGKVIRSYGTFPHPNVLAAFLVTSIWSAYYLFIVYANHMRARIPWLIVIAVLIFGLMSTYTRAAIVVWFGGSLALFAIFPLYMGAVRSKQAREKIRDQVILLGSTVVGLVIGFVLVNSAFIQRVTPTQIDNALEIREQYTNVGIDAFIEAPIIGIGIGNFVPYFQVQYASFNYPLWVFQPVHNIYALILTELGTIGAIVGTALLLALGIRVMIAVRIRQPIELIFLIGIGISFLLLSLFDHFFWTLQQGRLMWWLILGLLSISAMTTKSVRH